MAGHRSHSPFATEVLRSVTRSMGRFIAIAAIVAIGCGFFAGLRMTGTGMRKAADIYYDGTDLYDLELVSTLGISQKTVDAVAKTPGVTATMPSRSVDVMAVLGEMQVAARVTSIDVSAASAATVEGTVVASDDDGYLNRLILRTGRWPEAPNECVVLEERVEHLGPADSVEVLYGATSLDDVLEVRDFDIVGTVSSPTYVQSTSLATTTLGSGMIEQAVFVPEDAFDADSPYTELYLRVGSATGTVSATDAYQAEIDEVEDALEAKLDTFANERRAEVRADAQKTLDEHRSDFEREKADALAELDDAEAELEDAHAELVSGQASYESGLAEYQDGQRQIAAAEGQIRSGQRELNQSRSQLSAAERELAQGEAELAENRTRLEESQAAYDAGLERYEAQAAEATGTAQELEAAAGQLEAQLAQMGANDPARAELEARVAELRAQIEAIYDQLAAAKAQLDQSAAQLREGWAALAQGEARLEDSRAQIASGWKQVEAGEAELDSSRSQLADARAEAASGKAELDSAQRELQSGWADYEDGLATYERERADALERLADAEKELDDAQAEIDDIEKPDVFVLDRTKNWGAQSYTNDSERIDAIASVFPFFFFVVAALVALTTMTRMVDDDRSLIGTYKALGYSTLQISAKYLAYAASASGLGAVVGIAFMSQLLPWVIPEAYGIVYKVPQRPFPLPIEPGPATAAILLGMGCTLAATLAACVSSLRETPAALMQPKAPKAGKRILLERLGPLWKKITFSWKVTLRNIFRYKRRFSMTVIGIAGCTGLLVTGFGVRDAISDIISIQYGELVHHDLVIGLAEGATTGEVDDVVAYLEGTGGAGSCVVADTQNVVLRDASGEGDDHAVQLACPEDLGEFSEIRTLRDRLTHEEVPFEPDSVVLTEKLATTLGVSPGETFRLYEPNAVGNVTDAGVEVTLTAITENYIQSYLFVGPEAYRQIFDEAPSFDTIYTTMDEDPELRSEVAEHLQAMDDVDTVVFEDEMIGTYSTMLHSVDLVMVVLIVSAAALAFVVLYNLANINISERVREIASLKVLGFTRREVDAYVFREIILIVIGGALVGLVLGYFFEAYVVVTAEVDAAMFGRTVHWTSYVYSFALTMAFCALVLAAMAPKLNKIDMVESLKSVE